MKLRERLLHFSVSLILSLLIVGVPFCVYFDVFSKKEPDAVSQATMALPERPSGECVVLIKTSLHEDTIDEWRSFFGGEYAVIFDDIHCLAADGDAAGIQFAERYRAQLPENQMTVRTENAALLVSKAEQGAIDAAVFSKEMADALELEAPEGVTVFYISSDGE